MPTPPAPAWIERGLAGLEAAELEEAVVRRPEGHGDASGLLGREPVGDLPGEHFGHGPQLGVRAVEPDGDTRSPTAESGHVAPDLEHRAGALVPDDVRRRGPSRPAGRLRVSPPSMLIASTRTRISRVRTAGSGTSS